MSKQSVIEHLKKYNLDTKIITVPTSSATVKEAAEALGTEEARIAKTLSFKLKEKNIIIVVAGDVKIDNAKYKQTFSEKAHMLSHEEVEEITGHPVGGVCPFGVKPGVEIYLDESLKRFETVYPACGATNNAIELTISKLEEVTNYPQWIDVCKLKEET